MSASLLRYCLRSTAMWWPWMFCRKKWKNQRGPFAHPDREIEELLASGKLRLRATLDARAAYRAADSVVIAAPTNYDPQRNYFDTSAVENVIGLAMEANPEAMAG